MGNILDSRKYDIITFGDMCIDLIVRGDDVTPEFGQIEKLVGDYEVEMGGSCCIFACQAAKLGLKVGILGRVGKDSFGGLVVSRLKESGVDTQHIIVDDGLKTGLGIALCKGNDRAILTYLGSLNAIESSDVSDDFLQSSRHLHHGSYYLHTRLRPAIPMIFSRAKQLGLTISLDTNWDPEEKWDDGLDEILPYTDLFLPNEQEAIRISRKGDVEEAIVELHNKGIKIIAIKRGIEGALASNGHVKIDQPVKVVTGGDSIGAGDSFDAGFLSGWLGGLELDDCLRIANYCGQSVAAQVGGLRGQPTGSLIRQLENLK